MKNFINQRPKINMPSYGQFWSRDKYDKESIDTDLKQSTDPLIYALDPVFAEQYHPVFPNEIGWIGKQGVSYDSRIPMIDTESELFNITRVLSKDPKFKYHPKCIDLINGNPKCQPNLYHFPIDRNFSYQSTRLVDPPSTLREIGVNRFQPLCMNPQDPCRWEHPGEIGINYRLVAKDNHVPCLPHPIDQTPILPKGGKLPCVMITPTCGSPITALNHYRYISEQLPIN